MKLSKIVGFAVGVGISVTSGFSFVRIRSPSQNVSSLRKKSMIPLQAKIGNFENVDGKNSVRESSAASDLSRSRIEKVPEFNKRNKFVKIGLSSLVQDWKKWVQATMLALALFMTPLVINSDPAAATQTGGRMGGSFGSSGGSSRSYSSPSRSSYGGSRNSFSNPRFYGSMRPSTTIIAPVPVGGPVVYAPSYGYNPLSRVIDSFFNGVFFLAFMFIVVQGMRGSTDAGVSASPLGKGVSVASLSIALNVPNRNDPGSILSYLTQLSNTARTDSRVGLQNLVNNVAIGLLRQRRSIIGASSNYEHFIDSDRATRKYNQLVVNQRSKFEKETISKYKGVDYSIPHEVNDSIGLKATLAVVTIVFTIEGDNTKIPEIRSVSDVETALTRIAADSEVEDCLISAEVLWTPGDISETITEREMYADYPELKRV